MIYLGFQSTSGFFQSLIRWFTSSDVNHVAIEYTDPTLGMNWIIEADAKKGVIVRPRKKSKYKYRYRVSGNSSQLLEYLRKIIEDYTGKSYDYLGIVGFASFLLWWKLFKLRVRHPGHNTPGILCSELAAYLMKNLIEIKDIQWQSPADLLKICRENPELFPEENT